MINLVICELERIFSSKKLRVTFVISIIYVLLSSAFVGFFGLGFYDPNTTVKLTSLNFAPFVTREIHIFLAIVVCPIFFVETFNAEITNSTYRMIMIRPYSKLQMFFSKWLAQSLVFAMFILIIFSITTTFGFVALPKASSTTFFNLLGDYPPAGAILFGFRFYFYEYLVVLAILSINSLVSLLMPNVVLAFLGGAAILFASIYADKKFEFLLFSSKNIFDTLSRIDPTLLFYSLFIIVIGFILSGVIFVKRDFKW